MEVVTLTDEEGNDMDYIILETVEYDGDYYDVLISAEEAEDEEEEEAEVIILKKISESGDDVEYDVVDDEATIFAVFEIFKEIYARANGGFRNVYFCASYITGA